MHITKMPHNIGYTDTYDIKVYTPKERIALQHIFRKFLPLFHVNKVLITKIEIIVIQNITFDCVYVKETMHLKSKLLKINANHTNKKVFSMTYAVFDILLFLYISTPHPTVKNLFSYIF